MLPFVYVVFFLDSADFQQTLRFPAAALGCIDSSGVFPRWNNPNSRILFFLLNHWNMVNRHLETAHCCCRCCELCRYKKHQRWNAHENMSAAPSACWQNFRKTKICKLRYRIFSSWEQQVNPTDTFGVCFRGFSQLKWHFGSTNFEDRWRRAAWKDAESASWTDTRGVLKIKELVLFSHKFSFGFQLSAISKIFNEDVLGLLERRKRERAAHCRYTPARGCALHSQ